MLTADALEYFAEKSLAYFYEAGRKEDLDGNPIPLERNWAYQFHSAPHAIRLLAPGNGFGKTTIVSVEAEWWCQAKHPYQDMEECSKRERIILWACQKYQQWEIMRGQIERWWTRGFNYVGAPYYRYTWPGQNSAKLFVVTAETDWRNLQGIQPDLVVIDEYCDRGLWIELQKRRRGGGPQTRYCISATATSGINWAYNDLYLPWLQYHQALGMDEDQAIAAQLHRPADPELKHIPWIWCLPRGSHADNPCATKQTWAEQKQHTAGSKAERLVRLYGGFRSFNGAPVFDEDAVELMKKKLRLGRLGAFIDQEARVA